MIWCLIGCVIYIINFYIFRLQKSILQYMQMVIRQAKKLITNKMLIIMGINKRSFRILNAGLIIFTVICAVSLIVISSTVIDPNFNTGCIEYNCTYFSDKSGSNKTVILWKQGNNTGTCEHTFSLELLNNS